MNKPCYFPLYTPFSLSGMQLHGFNRQNSYFRRLVDVVSITKSEMYTTSQRPWLRKNPCPRHEGALHLLESEFSLPNRLAPRFNNKVQVASLTRICYRICHIHGGLSPPMANGRLTPVRCMLLATGSGYGKILALITREVLHDTTLYVSEQISA